MNDMNFLRTDSTNLDFQSLVKSLDADLRIRDGEEHAFFAQFNKIDLIKHVIVAYKDDIPVGCGAIKTYQDNIMEVKRMFVVPNLRGKGIATSILLELENWAKELTCRLRLILETGKKQPEAIALISKEQLSRVIDNFGQYAGVDSSVCFEKVFN
jgi:putative acetyltransferase